MADTNPAADAPANNPAEANASTESAEVQAVATTETTENATSADNNGVNGSADAAKDTESSTKEQNERPRQFDNKRAFRGRDRGGFGGNRPNRKRNNEFDNLPETDDPNEIRQQVEFYFNDKNLATDEHLFRQVQGSRNVPVSIKHLTQFKRMRRFKPYSAVVAALRDSADLVVVDDGEYAGNGKEGVKRKEPLVIPKRDGDTDRVYTVDEQFSRMHKKSANNLDNSIYAKNFAADGEEVGQIALEDFFRPFGSVVVRKRRRDDGTWKGSVFVEFANEELQQQFLAQNPKPKYNDSELYVMAKKEYSEMKCKEKGITPNWLKTDEERRAERNGRGGYGGRGRGRGRGGPGGRGRGGRDFNRRDRNDRNDRRDRDGSADRDDWKKRRDNFQDRDRDSRKRGREDDDAAGSPKRSKIEVKEDA